MGLHRPWVSRLVHEIRVAKLESLLESAERASDELRIDRDFWKDRACKLLDAGLTKNGEIVTPTMSEPAPAPLPPLAALVGMNKMSIRTESHPSRSQTGIKGGST